jgi:hypothetical protein
LPEIRDWEQTIAGARWQCPRSDHNRDHFQQNDLSMSPCVFSRTNIVLNILALCMICPSGRL